MQTLGIKPTMNITLHSQETMNVVINHKIRFTYSKQTKWLKVFTPRLSSMIGEECLFEEFQCEVETLVELEQLAVNFYIENREELDKRICK